LFGGVELAGLVEVKGFLQGHGQKRRQPRAGARRHIMPQPRAALACQLGYYSVSLIAVRSQSGHPWRTFDALAIIPDREITTAAILAAYLKEIAHDELQDMPP
jgi:hypothetical protein